jgi:hypothetical protein
VVVQARLGRIETGYLSRRESTLSARGLPPV